MGGGLWLSVDDIAVLLLVETTSRRHAVGADDDDTIRVHRTRRKMGFCQERGFRARSCR